MSDRFFIRSQCFACVGVCMCVPFQVPLSLFLHASAVMTNLTDMPTLHSFFCYFCRVSCGGMRHCVCTCLALLDFYVFWIPCNAPIPDCDSFLFFSSSLPPSYYFISCCVITPRPFLAMRHGPWLASSPASAQWGWTRPSGWQGNSSAPWPPWGNHPSAPTPPCTWYVPTVPSDWGSDVAFVCRTKDNSQE